MRLFSAIAAFQAKAKAIGTKDHRHPSPLGNWVPAFCLRRRCYWVPLGCVPVPDDPLVPEVPEPLVVPEPV
jgi:hypothetical protein